MTCAHKAVADAIRQLGGEIQVSASGQYTTFRQTLPNGAGFTLTLSHKNVLSSFHTTRASLDLIQVWLCVVSAALPVVH